MAWSGGRRRARAEDEVLALVRDHAAELLRFARRFSLCADDAQDAYQRTMEILVRRMREAPPDNPLSWVRTVLRHEAGAVREQRLRDLGREELDLDRQPGRALDDPADRAERFEELSRTAEALRRLKPQEMTALAMRAEGLSYHEICDRTGWTYTRCNRAITEGRRALIARIRAIESGDECDRWVPLLSRLADGEASARDIAEVRPHLRGCPACRATLRRFVEAPGQVGALLPAAAVPLALAGADGGAGWGIARHLEAVAHAVSERLAFGAMRVQGAIEAASGAKVAAVAASTAALAGSGVAIERAVTRPSSPSAPRAAAVAPARPADATAAPATWRVPLAPRSGGGAAGAVSASAPASKSGQAGPLVPPEFGFEAAPATGERGRSASSRRTARAASAAAAPATGRRAPRPVRRAPAEFAPPRSAATGPAAAPASSGAAPAGRAAPSPTASTPDPSPPAGAPPSRPAPEFAGP